MKTTDLQRKMITGLSVPEYDFRVRDVQTLTVDHLEEIYRMRLPVLRMPFLNKEECDLITRNFRENPGRRIRRDNVSAEMVGVDLYGKEPDVYLKETQMQKANVEALFEGMIDSVPRRIHELLRTALGDEVKVRFAGYQGTDFNQCRAICWTGSGQLALQCHDDKSQNHVANLKDLETYQVEFPLAFNVYAGVPEKGGELLIYNIQPDEATKRWLGVEFSGYPYPTELLANFQKLEVAPREGELIIAAGSFVHGVAPSSHKGKRILLNHFGGWNRNGELITWS